MSICSAKEIYRPKGLRICVGTKCWVMLDDIVAGTLRCGKRPAYIRGRRLLETQRLSEDLEDFR